ncbi:hypothetical protein BDQ17DRAFT_1437238 [Cyathus striatus]|nr:hypothetical protein BDQ17DRAFT_1437238 [Cyathus striatus]
MAPRSLRSATAAASSIPATSTRKSSVQRLKEDQQNEAAGKPRDLQKNSNISVAPPPHYRECSGTVTPASILQVPTPQDPFSSLSNDMGHLFNEHETSLVFSSHPGQIQEEDIDYEVIETTPGRLLKAGKIYINPYVFLWEDNGWSLTGQYSELLEDKDQEVQWELDEINLHFEGLEQPAANVSGVPSVFSEEASTSSASKLGESTEAQKRIIDFFNVPLALLIMELAGRWQNKMPPISVIATIFTSVPAYYRWKALLASFQIPKMELWFEGNPDISYYEVWKGEPQTQEALKIILKKFVKEDKKLAKEKDEDSSADDNYKSKDKGKQRKE